MQARYRLYRRSNRSHGTYYAQDSTTGARESLGTKNKAEALKLLQAKNDAQSQPVLSRELAKVYLHTLAEASEELSLIWRMMGTMPKTRSFRKSPF
jgi:hypothetical protein